MENKAYYRISLSNDSELKGSGAIEDAAKIQTFRPPDP